MRITLVAVTAALLLAACGKKGDPLPPPGYEKPPLSKSQPAPDTQQNQTSQQNQN